MDILAIQPTHVSYYLSNFERIMSWVWFEVVWAEKFIKLAMYLKKSNEERGIVREKYDLGQYLEQDRSIQGRDVFISLKCIWKIFFICSIKSPQCADKWSKKNFSIAIFLPRVLMCQKRQISLPVGYKTATPKTGDWERLWRQFRTPSLAKNRLLSHFLIVS